MMGKYSGMTNEIVFEDGDNLLLKWSDEKETFSFLAYDESVDLFPIRTYYQSCPLKWVPKF